MKTVRDTSIDAYLTIKENGLLNKNQQQVYETLFNKGSMTCSEVLQYLNLQTNQSGRFTELKEKGVIKEVGKRECRVTGHRVYLWDVTSELPKTKRQRSKKHLKQDGAKVIKHIKETALLDDSHIRGLEELQTIINNL